MKNAEHGAKQDEAETERMYVLEETVLCMVESLYFLRKLCNVVQKETGEAHLRNLSECTLLQQCGSLLQTKYWQHCVAEVQQRSCVENKQYVLVARGQYSLRLFTQDYMNFIVTKDKSVPRDISKPNNIKWY